MVTYPVWPSRTFTRCKGHSNDLDKSSFRHDASLDADGSLRRRPARDGEKISPVCGTELEGAPGIVSAMILSGHDFAINLFRLPFSSHARDGGNGQNKCMWLAAHPILSAYHNLDATSGLCIDSEGLPLSGRIESIHSDPIVIRSQSTAAKCPAPATLEKPRIPVNHETFRSRPFDSPMISPTL